MVAKIGEAVSNGVVKMNIGTEALGGFTRRMKNMYRDRGRMKGMPEPGAGCDWGDCWPGHGALCSGHPEAAEEGMLPVEVLTL